MKAVAGVVGKVAGKASPCGGAFAKGTDKFPKAIAAGGWECGWGGVADTGVELEAGFADEGPVIDGTARGGG